MLHIVNGDSVAIKLKAGKLQGDILPWRELLTEGPLRADDSEQLIQERAAYFEQAMRIPAAVFAESSRHQREQLARFSSGGEIVLWFEHDLYDQVMLLSLLHIFGEREWSGANLQLVCIGDYPGVERFTGLGALSVEQLMSLVGTWRPITREHLMLARRAWLAYTAEDPRELSSLLEDRTVQWQALPYLRAALAFHLLRFPSIKNGLGAVEETTLEQLAAEGSLTLAPLFRHAGDAHPLYGMGDLQYWGYLERMRSGKQPLIRIEGPGELPGYEPTSHGLHEWAVSITSAGLDVLRGMQDAIRLNGIDRWLGGARLRGDGSEPIWRYGGPHEMFVRI